MKALVKYGQQPDMVELRDVPEPVVRPGGVLVQVKAAGICGWDIEMWKHRMANPVTVPVVQGHEFCGVVTRVGEGVSGWHLGDAVACETSAAVCGSCFWCRSGDYQLCPDRKGFGYGVDGAFTTTVAVRQEILHRVPPSLSFNEAALTEPFCVAHHALADQVAVRRDESVLVIGPGPIGLVCCQMARALGAGRVILVGRAGDRRRLDLAFSQGWADKVILSDSADIPVQVRADTGGIGVDVAADCAGNTAALESAIVGVRKGGRIVKIGWGPQPYGRSLDDLLRKSIHLVGTFGHNARNWRAVIEMMGDGRLKAQPLISNVFPLSRWKEAFEQMEFLAAIKNILYPDE